MFGDDRSSPRVERYSPSRMGLGSLLHEPVRSGHDPSLDRDRGAIEIHVAPPQRDRLRSSSAGRRREHQVTPEVRGLHLGSPEHPAQRFGGRRLDV